MVLSISGEELILDNGIEECRNALLCQIRECLMGMIIWGQSSMCPVEACMKCRREPSFPISQRRREEVEMWDIAISFVDRSIPWRPTPQQNRVLHQDKPPKVVCVNATNHNKSLNFPCVAKSGRDSHVCVSIGWKDQNKDLRKWSCCIRKMMKRILAFRPCRCAQRHNSGKARVHFAAHWERRCHIKESRGCLWLPQ